MESVASLALSFISLSFSLFLYVSLTLSPAREAMANTKEGEEPDFVPFIRWKRFGKPVAMVNYVILAISVIWLFSGITVVVNIRWSNFYMAWYHDRHVRHLARRLYRHRCGYRTSRLHLLHLPPVPPFFFRRRRRHLPLDDSGRPDAVGSERRRIRCAAARRRVWRRAATATARQRRLWCPASAALRLRWRRVRCAAAAARELGVGRVAGLVERVRLHLIVVCVG